MSGMISMMKTLAAQEGYNLTALPDVRILRADRPLARTPVLYDPGIVIVCQGSKRGVDQAALVVAGLMPRVRKKDRQLGERSRPHQARASSLPENRRLRKGNVAVLPSTTVLSV